MSGQQRPDLNNYPWLRHVDILTFSYPSLRGFVSRITNSGEHGRQLVNEKSVDKDGKHCSPGRCCVLEFYTSSKDTRVETIHLKNVHEIQDYLNDHSPILGDPVASDCRHRLYILEDLAPEYVELIGRHLHVDPLVFAGQMNTWRFLNTDSIAQRTLPSLSDPVQSFTVRYPELRCYNKKTILDDARWTFAANRRKIDAWYPIPGGRIELSDEVSIVRRCMSFWVDNARPKGQGWNALILVDPAVDAFKAPHVPTTKGGTTTYWVLGKQPGSSRKRPFYESTSESSRAFHFGHPDPIPSGRAFRFTAAGSGTGKSVFRRKGALFDEIVLYWTQKDNEEMIKSVIENPSNTANYVLKAVAYHWTNLMELILSTMNQAEFVADEGRHPENFMGDDPARASLLANNNYAMWKKQISRLYIGIWYFNIFRRRLAYYEDDLDQVLATLNPAGDDTDMRSLPEAIRGANMDFKALSARLKLYKTRADMLASTADEIVNLRGAAKSLDDSAFNLRIAIFAAIVFPATFVASLFGMSDGFAPGDGQFWIFWVVAIPLVLLMVLVVAGGRWFRNIKVLKRD